MKLFKLLMTLGVILLIFSCSEDERANVESEEQSLTETHVCGYDYYTQPGNESIVKRQEVFDDTAIGEACDVANLTISIDPCFDALPVYLTAITNAVAMYNAIPNCVVSITIVPEPGDIHIDCFDQACASGSILGGSAGQFYDNDNTTNSIEINTNAAEMGSCCGGTFGLCDITGLIAHEIGHVIGLAHTGSGDGDHIPGTAQNDAASLFNGGSLCAGICTFSPDDILALQTLYPEWALCPSCEKQGQFNIEGPLDLCVDEVGTFCITGLSPEWTATMTSSGSTPVSGGNFCQDFSYSDARIHRVYVRACHNVYTDCCVEKTFEVSVVPEDGECYCICEAQEQASIEDISWSKGGLGKGKVGHNNIEEWVFPIDDCCDPRPCSEIIPEWWDEYLVDERDCFKKEVGCTPPSVVLEGPDTICVGQGYDNEICIAGTYNSTTNWSSNSGTLFYSSPDCRNFTAYSPGTYTITVEVCSREDGEGQEDCCVTLTKTVVAEACDVECYCECEDGDGNPVELVYDCDEVGDCWDIFYEDDIYNCEQKTR